MKDLEQLIRQLMADCDKEPLVSLIGAYKNTTLKHAYYTTALENTSTGYVLTVLTNGFAEAFRTGQLDRTKTLQALIDLLKSAQKKGEVSVVTTIDNGEIATI